MTEREFAISVVQQLQTAGHEALWAGGCVRDELLGLTPTDYDVATDARPEQVQKLFRRTLALGASFGVIEVLGPRVEGDFLKVQVATFRSDLSYSDGRRPDQVVFSSAKEDALRRDFTVNGMFYDPIKGQLHDYINGQADLHARILRAIGEPTLRFREDKLRLLRAVRIATRFELAIEPATESAIKALAKELPVVSAERIAAELRLLLVHPRRVHGLDLLMDLGLCEAILPELLPTKVHGQPDGTLWDHIKRVMDLIGPTPSFPLAFAALLHDVAKPCETAQPHAQLGAAIADAIALRLKLSKAERDRIVWLIEHHNHLKNARSMRPSQLKTMFIEDGIHELLVLHRADALASSKSVDLVEYCEHLLNSWTAADLNPPFLVTGDDLKGKGLEPGPIYKQLLD